MAIGVNTFHRGYSFYISRSQDFLDERAHGWFIFDDECASVCDTRFLPASEVLVARFSFGFNLHIPVFFRLRNLNLPAQRLTPKRRQVLRAPKASNRLNSHLSPGSDAP